MAKLTRAQVAAHKTACAILERSGTLNVDAVWDVFDNWHEAATNLNSAVGAHFTPTLLARDFALEAGGERRVIDLCAGIGVLSWMVRTRHLSSVKEVVCIEANPAYVEVGRRIFPEATWICGDVFSVDLASLGHFDLAVGNPPFGSTATGAGQAPRYTGREMEYRVIDVASNIADRGAFIVPQMSAPFRFSGVPYYREKKEDRYLKFSEQTAIDLECGGCIDCGYYRDQWRDVALPVEIVHADFEATRTRRAAARMVAARRAATTEQLSLFAA